MPVIAEAQYSGTAAYALDDRSKFPAGDAKALAARIDYWFNHPQERWEMGFQYAESMKQYEIANCAQALIEMFQKAIDSTKYAIYPLHTPVLTSIGREAIRLYRRIA